MGIMQTPVVARNYRDNFDVKKLTTDILIPKFFPDEDISTRMFGMIGMTTEQMSVISEDTFNTVSALLKEFFITKATLPESIYTHGALFQLADAVGVAATCRFVLVFNEYELSKIFENANVFESGVKDVIYIGRGLKLFVEGIPFTLDYDIEIARKKTKLSATEYVYTAKYIITEFTNAISSIKNPYIKIRRTTDGYFALEVIMHQCEREETTHSIVDNSTINYPVVPVGFHDILAGFDAYYRTSADENWTQMKILVENSLPEKDPFCYYRLIAEDKMRLSFSLNDSYFQPEFNSEIKVVTYTTKGTVGNFPMYEGDSIQVIKDSSVYPYNEDINFISVIVGSASKGGLDSLDIESLRILIANQYRTATVLSTDHDLELYFDTFESRNDNIIRFMKRRNDNTSRLFTGFMVCKNKDYVYPTNTLDVSINYQYLKNRNGGLTFVMDPGNLFTYNATKNMVVPLCRNGVDTPKKFYDESGRGVTQWLYRDYFRWLYDVNPMQNPSFDDDDPDWAVNWIHSKKQGERFVDYIQNVALVCDNCGYSSHIMRVKKDGTIVCPVCGGGKIYKGMELTDLFLTVFDTQEVEERVTKDMFVFSNPFLMTLTKHPGLINYYLTIIDQVSLLDFTNYNIDTPLQFIINKVHVERPLAREKEYTVTLDLMSSMQHNSELLVPGITKSDYVGRRSQLNNNNLRVFMIIKEGGVESCYIEMVPISVTEDGVIRYQVIFKTNDHITLGNQMQLVNYDIDEIGFTPPGDIGFGDPDNPDPGNPDEGGPGSGTGEHNNFGTEFHLDVGKKRKIWVQNIAEVLPVENIHTEFSLGSKNPNNIWVETIHNPNEPDNPGDGEDPDNPGDGEGENPDNPDPDNPENPGDGSDPDNPDNPGDGEDPDNPENPDTPDEPEEKEDTSGPRGNFTFLTNSTTQLVPIEDVEVVFVTVVKEIDEGVELPTNNFPTSKNMFNLDKYCWTNTYSTFSDPIDFIKPLRMIRSSMYFRDDRLYNVNYGDIFIYSVPFIKYTLLKHYHPNGTYTKNENGRTNYEMFKHMIREYYDQYEYLERTLATILEQVSHIDLKFYNTYGISKNYIIGDDNELIDRVNMSMAFDIYLVQGTDEIRARSELRSFIKEYIERLNDFGSNDFHISNLIRSIENTFAYVDHIRFVGINGDVDENGSYEKTDYHGYDTEYQSVRNITKDLDDLSKDERFAYVPEMLCINLGQICLSFFSEEP